MWFKGGVQNEAIWILENIYVYEYFLLPFGFRFGNLQSTFVDVSTYDLIVEFPLKTTRPKAL